MKISAMAIGDRIKEAAKRVGGQKPLSGMISVSDRTLSDYIAGKTSPQISVLEEIAEATGLDVIWLVTGDEGTNSVGRADKVAEIRDMVYVPVLDVQASAGLGAVVESEPQTGVMALRRDLLRSLGISSTGSLKILEARGNSMEPLIRAGDLLLVDTSIDRVEDEGVYVFRRGSTVIVKRLRVTVMGGVELVSDNGNIAEAIPSEDLPDLHAAGRVVRVIRAV